LISSACHHRRSVSKPILRDRCNIGMTAPGQHIRRCSIDQKPGKVHDASMLIYKIFRRAEWDAFRAAGITTGAPIDVADGYVHFSTAAQVAETAARHFARESDLVLLALNTATLGDALKWEPSRGGALFPHLYRPLRLSDVIWDKSLPLGATGHIFPEGFW
jgi:uncharacterized protein (DUF952 family)